MDMNLDMRQAQSLSPQMIQSMKVLQMNAQELLDYIHEALVENPVLESEEPRQPWEETENGRFHRKLEWLASTDRQNRFYHEEDERDMADPVGAASADPGEESLYHYLRAQVQFETLSASLAAAVLCVLENLNGAGWLDESTAELAAQLGIRERVMERAVELVQALEPAGVGARSLSECLCLQLKRKGETGLPLTIASRCLEEMGRHQYHRIAQMTGAGRAEVQAACEVIRALDPKPGADFAPREFLGYITPDVVIANFADHLEILVNDTRLPTLRVSSYYSRLMKETDDVQVKDYLTEKVRKAQWLLRSVEQRQSTLLRCVQCIAQRQEAFFRQGPGCLRPMSLRDVAAALDIHESTVSRAVRGKYLQCVQGIYPLGYFFSRALPASGGEGTAEQAKTALRQLIADEDKGRPLSDQKLCGLLAAQGIELSRRTVAKYREELGIPAASGRKKL